MEGWSAFRSYNRARDMTHDRRPGKEEVVFKWGGRNFTERCSPTLCFVTGSEMAIGE